MSHEAQIHYISGVKKVHPQYFSNQKVLEVGSLDINGSVRQFFQNCDYTGIDVGEGKGVDVVCKGEDYEEPDDTFDVSITCECFEHNPEWVETFNNMHRMTKPKGIVIMTCATTGRPEHGTSRTSPCDSPLTINLGWEYYKNLTEGDFRESFNLDDMFSSYQFMTNTKAKDLYFWGVVK